MKFSEVVLAPSSADLEFKAIIFSIFFIKKCWIHCSNFCSSDFCVFTCLDRPIVHVPSMLPSEPSCEAWKTGYRSKWVDHRKQKQRKWLTGLFLWCRCPQCCPRPVYCSAVDLLGISEWMWELEVGSGQAYCKCAHKESWFKLVVCKQGVPH